MRQDQRGCRRVLVDGTLGCLVLVLSLIALIVIGRHAVDGGPEPTPGPATEAPAADDPPEGAEDARAADLRARLEDALRD